MSKLGEIELYPIKHHPIRAIRHETFCYGLHVNETLVRTGTQKIYKGKAMLCKWNETGS